MIDSFIYESVKKIKLQEMKIWAETSLKWGTHVSMWKKSSMSIFGERMLKVKEELMHAEAELLFSIWGKARKPMWRQVRKTVVSDRKYCPIRVNPRLYQVVSFKVMVHGMELGFYAKGDEISWRCFRREVAWSDSCFWRSSGLVEKNLWHTAY